MEVFSPGLQWYVNQINEGKRFSFIRYGNGEWDCILRLYHETRSGSQRFTPDLRAAMEATLTNARGGTCYTAIQSVNFLARVSLLPQIEEWLSGNAPNLQWHDGEVLVKASIYGKLYPFVSAIKKYKIVVVGPRWTLKLPFAKTFVPVASHNAWTDNERTYNCLKDMQNSVILFSAGPLTKVLIHRLYPSIGKSCWLIDCGSLWDPYCGHHTRRYHKRITPALIRLNLTGKK